MKEQTKYAYLYTYLLNPVLTYVPAHAFTQSGVGRL